MEPMAFEILEATLDGAVRQGRYPEPIDWFRASSHLVNVPKDQFSFSSCIRCTHDSVYLWIIHVLLDDLKLLRSAV